MSEYITGCISFVSSNFCKQSLLLYVILLSDGCWFKNTGEVLEWCEYHFVTSI